MIVVASTGQASLGIKSSSILDLEGLGEIQVLKDLLGLVELGVGGWYLLQPWNSYWEMILELPKERDAWPIVRGVVTA